MAIGSCIVLRHSKSLAVSVGTPCTRLTCHYCNRSCNSKSPEATIISIFLTDKVQPNIFVMVSHKVSCWPVKALQQSLVPAATQDRIQDLYAEQVPPVCLSKSLNAMGVTANARCWEKPEQGPSSELALLAVANQGMSKRNYAPVPT